MIKRRRIITAINYFMILVFLLAAGFQYNDVDATLWMLTYGAATLACITWRWNPLSYYWYLALGSVCLVWAVSLLIFHADQLSWNGMFDSIQMKNNSVEIIREVGGLIIIAVWMGILAYVPPEKLSAD